MSTRNMTRAASGSIARLRRRVREERRDRRQAAQRHTNFMTFDDGRLVEVRRDV